LKTSSICSEEKTTTLVHTLLILKQDMQLQKKTMKFQQMISLSISLNPQTLVTLSMVQSSKKSPIG
jgi:hypothetical protein